MHSSCGRLTAPPPPAPLFFFFLQWIGNSWVKPAARGEGGVGGGGRNEINMVLQRDQVTVWERFLKCHLDEIERVSFNLGDFGLARAADDLVHSLAGQRPNLSPWKSYWAMGLCPDTPRKAVNTPPGFRWAQRGLVARGRGHAYLFYDQMFNIWMELRSFCLIIRWKSWMSAPVLDQPGRSFDLHVRP